MRVVDMHCDTIHKMYYERREGKTVTLEKNDLHIDILKMQKSGYMLQNFAMFVNCGDTNTPYEECKELVSILYDEIEKNKENIGLIKKYSDIKKNIDNNRISAMLTLEDGGVCEGDINKLREFYDLGARMMTLTWNYENELAYPNRVISKETNETICESEDEFGVKDKGIEFLDEMEKLGVIVDVSHLADKGFYDVYKNTTKPFVASHSNARALSPHVRNLTDDMIRKIANRGGVIGMNYYSLFLEGENSKNINFTITSQIVKHMQYIYNLGGIECVGLGSDFDGITCDLEMKNCSYINILIEEMQKGGFKENQIDKILNENVLRVYKDTIE